MPQGKCHVALSAAVRRAALLCVFFAATFASGTILSPHASAQQPGGGGSPGGGSSPDGSAAGWVPQPRPGVTDPQSYGDYDWTGLDGSVIRTPFTGSYPPEIYHDYGGSEGFSTGGSYFMEYPFNGTGGTGNTLAEVYTQFSGTTTYKWKWVPPNNAAGQPDTANFPAPTLFTLYDMYATLGTQLWSPPYNAGLAASGTVSDGAPDNWTSSVSTVPQVITDVFPRQMVLPGSAPDSGGVSSVAMALSGNLDVTGKQSVVVGGYTGTGAMCISATTVNGQAYPITLAAPDPLTNPLLGDGTNQYVYDTEQPDGYLAVPASVSVPGAGTADTAFLLPHVALSVAPAMQTGAQPFQWTNSGSQMYVYTSGSYPSGTSYPSAAFVYKGLPPNNSYFGNHTMTMKVDGTVSQTANYQLFFNATTNNYPGALEYDNQGALSYTGIPDWYFYYNQVYPAPGGYKMGKSSEYNPDANTIDISDDAHGVYTMRIFHLNSSTNKVEYLGSLSLAGLHTYIEVIGHELGHKYAANHNIEVSNSTASHPDHDNDGLDDNWELLNGFDPNKSDTTGAYANIPSTDADFGKGDRECVADIQALGALLTPTASGTVKSLWKQDWANDGSQWGTWNQHTPALNPSAPYWPWYFASSVNGARAADPPSDALSKLTQLPNNGN